MRNRIKELRRVPASDLRPNPANWRKHPEFQQNAIRSALARIGVADACLARELEDGSLMLIDGHLRAETMGDAPVPVLVLDVDENEAAKLLLTIDSVTALAMQDVNLLSGLIEDAEIEDEIILEMLDKIASKDEWDGPPPIDPDEIEPYDENAETLTIKVQQVPVDRLEHVHDIVESAMATCDMKYSVTSK